MSLTTPRTMRGVMELLPLQQIAFQRFLDIIRTGYERFGFLPIETPVMEYRDILLTKSGGETERQVYFVQSTGSLEQGKAPELALRFDLTVPLARYVAEHENQLVFPFRRYQMQRVYRGENAQKGRYREFYQCDIDVIGKDELALDFDAEIPVVIYHIFKQLELGKFTIHINNRKLMTGFFAAQGVTPELQGLVLREVDKLDKRGDDYVVNTLTGEGFGLDPEKVAKIMAFIKLEGANNTEVLERLTALGVDDPTFREGHDALSQVCASIRAAGVPDDYCKINLSIARGLDYYTGTVYETTLDDHPGVGSVCSGGRYENLAGHYTNSHLPGVGISIGATRLFYKLQEAGLVPEAKSSVHALVLRLDNALASECLALASLLREGGINTEVQHQAQKLGRQVKYADRSGIRFAVILGEDEVANGTVTVKDLVRSEQFSVSRAELVQALKERLA